MGLDAVELLMAVEEKFGVSITDEEATKAVTVGDLKQLVKTKLDVADADGCLTQRAFHLIRKKATAEFGVLRRNLNPMPRLRLSFHNLLGAKVGTTFKSHSAWQSCQN